MVQRIHKSAKIAVHNILKGEPARLITAGIFYVCTPIYGVAPVWRLNGPTALEVLCNGSAAPFFFVANQTTISEMHNTENTCLAGKNSTQQATDSQRKGLKEIIQIAYQMSLYYEVDDNRDRLKRMFFEWLKCSQDLDSELVREAVWCFEDLNSILDHLNELIACRTEMHAMLYPGHSPSSAISDLTLVN